jgi:hypothetical protein
LRFRFPRLLSQKSHEKSSNHFNEKALLSFESITSHHLHHLLLLRSLYVLLRIEDLDVSEHLVIRPINDE